MASIIEIKKNQCCGCYACSNICPKQCIQMIYDNEGFRYPSINLDKCINCGLCNQVCPTINVFPDKTIKPPRAYACATLNDDIRRMSSSGGMFYLIAKEILQGNGIVYGAAFSGNYRSVMHIEITDVADLYKLQGSKYLQSDIEKTYTKAKAYLDANRKVLFSGTPCQIEGLKCYLRKDYKNLLCVDIICHGVPSVKVWNAYLKYIENKYESTVAKVSCRSKIRGWRLFSMHISLENGKEYIRSFKEDPYMKAFLQNACLRPSCHNCSFKKLNRVADVTLADFWGIDKVIPRFTDDMGTSLLLIHSSKGQKIFERILSQIWAKEVDANTALSYNIAALASVRQHKKREAFFKNIDALKFDKLVNTYAKKKKLIWLRIITVKFLKKMHIWELLRRLKKD